MRPEGNRTGRAVLCREKSSTLASPQKYFYTVRCSGTTAAEGSLSPVLPGRRRGFWRGYPGDGRRCHHMLRNLLEAIGLGGLNFELNSIGCAECRPAYRQALLDFFSG
jgi:hypothetical protein